MSRSGAWAACGANLARMTPEEHDGVFAAVSHFPHLLAFGLVADIAGRDNAKQLFGYAAADALGRNIGLFMPAAMAAEHDQHIQRYLDTGEARVIGRGREVEAQRRDGVLAADHRLHRRPAAGARRPRT